MTKYFKVKAFSEMTDVSIKTLHHYDAIGLLKPKTKTESGYRLYSEADMLQLQQILTLKYLGFSLKEIKTILETTNIELEKMLSMQLDALNERIQDLKIASRLLQKMLTTLQIKQPILWENNLKFIKVMKMRDRNLDDWFKDYLSKEERLQLKSMEQQYDKAFIEDYHRRWDELMQECAKHKNEDPTSEIGLKLGERGWKLINEVWGDNLALGRKLWEATKAGAPSRNNIDADDETLDFYDKAVKNYIKKKVKNK